MTELKKQYLQNQWSLVAFVGGLIALFLTGVQTYKIVWSGLAILVRIKVAFSSLKLHAMKTVLKEFSVQINLLIITCLDTIRCNIMKMNQSCFVCAINVAKINYIIFSLYYIL